MLGRLWGKAGKAGKAQQPQQAPAPHGRASAGNAIAAAGMRYGSQPLARSYAARLGVVSSLTSPATVGRFRPGTSASPANRGETPDFGAQQAFRGMVGKLSRHPRVGAQGGPSAQPGYPSTGGAGGIVAQLAALGRPDRMPIGGLS